MVGIVGDHIEEIARRLDRALENRKAIPPLSDTEGLDSLTVAYQIQNRWSELRAERGELLLGHKIGLISQAMRDQIGVDELDYGRSRFYPARGGRATIPVDVFVQPRVQGELAFLIGKPLDRTDCTADHRDRVSRSAASGCAVYGPAPGPGCWGSLSDGLRPP